MVTSKEVKKITIYFGKLKKTIFFVNSIARRDAVLYLEMQFCNLTTKYLKVKRSFCNRNIILCKRDATFESETQPIQATFFGV